MLYCLPTAAHLSELRDLLVQVQRHRVLHQSTSDEHGRARAQRRFVAYTCTSSTREVGGLPAGGRLVFPGSCAELKINPREV